MKKTSLFLLTTIVLCILIGMSGCCDLFGTCDKCQNITCQNGGVCIDGTCSCSSNAYGKYTGTYCEIVPNGSGNNNNNNNNNTGRGCTNPHSFNYNPNATIDDGSCQEMYGCLGYTTGYTSSGYITNTLGNSIWDQKMIEEISIQSAFFGGIPAAVFVLVEPSVEQKNAYADPGEGRILFGYYMFYYTVQVYGELPIAGILAHEWGHRVQQMIGWQNYTRVMQKELEADAFSGYYMALRKQMAWSQIQSYYQNVYATGDYNYNHPDHHGTGDQRVKAAYLGVNTAIAAMQNSKSYTYNELHVIFMEEINAHIGQKIKNTFPEVVYPKLSAEQIKKLFPKI